VSVVSSTSRTIAFVAPVGRQPVDSQRAPSAATPAASFE
jgi:hypothetical protein